MERTMALAFLLLVFLIVVLAIAAFVFPPSKWLEWFHNQKK